MGGGVTASEEAGNSGVGRGSDCICILQLWPHPQCVCTFVSLSLFNRQPAWENFAWQLQLVFQAQPSSAPAEPEPVAATTVAATTVAAKSNS